MTFAIESVEDYIRQHSLCSSAAEYVRGAAIGVSRWIGTSGFSCLVTEYQSLKMGVTVTTESRTGELSYAIHLDYDPEVVAFFEQPPAVDCVRSTKRGRQSRIYHPDFLVLRKCGPEVIEIKPDRKLAEILSASPDWENSNGTYIDKPARDAFLALGLRHMVVPTSALGRVRTANLKLLLRASVSIAESAYEDVRRRCDTAFKTSPLLTLEELKRSIGLIDAAPIYALIYRRQLHAAIDEALLSEPGCLIARDLRMLEAPAIEAHEFLRHARSGQPSPKGQSSLLPVERYLKRALDRAERLDKGECSKRTARRWRALMKSGETTGCSYLVALTPAHNRSGRREAQRPLMVLAYCENHIRTNWASLENPTAAALFRSYRVDAEGWHPAEKCVSRPTFRQILRALQPILAKQRGGNRAGNAADTPTNVEDRALTATRPFEMASCDHYLCDLYCVVLEANGVKYAKQPWLTVLRDVFTKSVLAVWLSFETPSRRHCAMVLRMCVRQYGRLPELIVVDRGAEFRSIYFSALLAHCGVDLMFRPSGHPRYGCEAEGFFFQLKTHWLSMRPGNRVSVKEVRSVSGSHHPQRRACIELTDLYEEVLAFAKWLDASCLGDGPSKSPGVLLAEGLAQASCSGIQQAYDHDFVIASAIEAKSYALDRQRGLHIGPRHYWAPALSELSSSRGIDVRIDPEDPYRVYALVRDRWVTCFASASSVHTLRSAIDQAAHAVLTTDCDDVRKLAKAEAERSLVHLVRQQDANRTERRKAADASVASPPADNDPFSEHDADVVSLDAEEWA